MLGPNTKLSATALAALVVAMIFIPRGAAAEQPALTSNTPDLSSIVQRIVQEQERNHDVVHAYSVTRQYKLFSGDASQPKTQVLAQVNFLPPNQKSYDINQSTGGIGEKVVRHILDHEVDATRDPRDVMISPENYRFDLEGQEVVEGQPCFKLHITPKHDRKDLLKADIWVGESSYRILRMDGETSKSPSFWVKDVHLVINFAEVSGMWLQTQANAVARLRFGGEYKVLAKDVDYQVAQSVATATPNAAPLHRRSRAAILATSMR